MVLCFGFVIERALITHQRPGCCWAVLAQHQDPFSRSALAVSRLRVGKKLGGNTSGTAEPSLPRGWSMPCNMVSNKNWGEGLCGRQPLLRDWLGFNLPVGGGELLPLHHLGFLCLFTFFLLLSFIKLSLSWLTSFLAFALPILSLVLLRMGNERLAEGE